MKCLVCEGAVAVDREIACDLCKKFVHTTCSGLTRNEISCLKTKERKIHYYCDVCSEFKNQLATIHELKDTINKLRSEVEILKDKYTQELSTKEKHEVQQLDVEKVIAEIQNRKHRENNLIIYNVVESKASTPKEKNSNDLTKINSVLSTLPNIENNSIIKIERLGKPTSNNNKPRPIKVHLRDKIDVYYILKNKKQLRIDGNPIRLTTDQTIMQRNYLSSIKQKLQQFKDDGDDSKTIKYISNIPTIINKSDNQIKN